GGRAAGFPALGPEDISLNIDATALPHVKGDINRAPFESGAFAEVYFERVPFISFTGENTGAVFEAARLLKLGGRLIIETVSKAPTDSIRTGLRAAGFKNVRLTEKGLLRFTTILGATS